MAHDLNSNALINFDTYIQFLGDREDETTIPEDHVNLFINAASSVIEQYCDRLFRDATGLVEEFDGDGEKDHYTRNRPIVQDSTAIKLECWNGVSWDELTTDQATRAVQEGIGRVYFNDGTRFGRGEDNWRITYDYGYALVDVPADLQLACAVLVQRAMKKAEGEEGVQSESLVDRSVSINLSNLPDDVKRILNSHRNVSIG